MNKNNLDISIIVPVLNEQNNVLSLVQRIDVALTKAKLGYEIIFVDDGSTDKTLANVNKLASHYPVKGIKKEGKIGKAYSILEGANVAKADWVVMIDGDLQYPPEAIPQMWQLAQTENHGVVVGKRISQGNSPLRRLMSHSFKKLFGGALFGLNCDIQSGLKLFRKEFIEHIDIEDLSGWSIDLPLLKISQEWGFTIGEVPIEFHKRLSGDSKISVLKSSYEIGTRALKLKLKGSTAISLKPTEGKGMLGAGVMMKGKKYVSHTTLSPHKTAMITFSQGQIIFFSLVGLILIIGLVSNFLLTLQIVVGALSVVYFLDFIWSFLLTYRSLHDSPEIKISDEEVDILNERELPIYTILCPLYKEAHVLPHFLESISQLDWPKNKLDVQLLLEEDDQTTIDVARGMDLPNYVHIIVVPNSQPKTKPKACNYGLAHAKGEYLVIYDAEDKPDPKQLKKAYLSFQQVGPKVVCLQAKLNYYNPHQNLLTRLFTAEYSLWFDLNLPSLQSVNTTIPLGGTSNHFRVADLHRLEGWDPFNVTEDCDLGVRLFMEGSKTAIIDSTTYEEANSKVKNWIRQRSRWIKGYMQTYLIHMKQPVTLVKKQGIHAAMFQLTIGGKIAFMFINPFLWIMTLSYFTLYAFVGPQIESLYPSTIFYLAVTSLLGGNFLYLYYYMIACAKRGQWSLVKYVFFVPFYWLIGSIAAMMALYELIVRPHYWQKTVHGLHLINKDSANDNKQKSPSVFTKFIPKPLKPFLTTSIYRGISWMMLGMILANFTNFVFSVYLGKSLGFTDFGNFSLFSNLLFLILIPMYALGGTVSHQVAYILGGHGKSAAKNQLFLTVLPSAIIGSLLVIVWLLAAPFLNSYFQVDSMFQLWIFTPIFMIALLSVNFDGYLGGTLSFGKVAFVTVVEAITKLLLAITFVHYGLGQWIVSVIPISMGLSLILNFAWTMTDRVEHEPKKNSKFDWRFYITSIMNGLTTLAFLSLDVVLVKHFLPPEEAGKYAVLSLVGKMCYFFGSLPVQFMIPLVSKNEGASQNSRKIFLAIFIGTFILSILAISPFLFFGNWILPILLGQKVNAVLSFIPVYLLAMTLFTISRPIVAFYQAKKRYLFALISFVMAIAQVILLFVFHESIYQVVELMSLISLVNLCLLVLAHFFHRQVGAALQDLFELVFFKPWRSFNSKPNPLQRRILILNWRDTKHVWAGGAETYVHELGKRWVQEGHQVTLFCGNDGNHSRTETIDGIQIVRRGGLYTVYFWSMMYYIFRFRGKYDLVIESVNGIPFFTPFYVTKPKFLLIHHVHQEVFREHLPFGLSHLARFLEGVVMPIIYREQKVITVSESSKKDILKLKFYKNANVEVVYPGISLENYYLADKTSYPSLLYVGRLKNYKNIDTALRAFAEVLTKFPNSVFTIAGFGDARDRLEALAKELNIISSVNFLGKVSEERKLDLLATSWLMIQPSMIEGWGITVIEANASGTTVIASDVKGLRDSVVDGKTGLLVKAEDSKMFAESIIKLIENKSFRDQLSKESIKWSQQFDWQMSANKFMNIINEVVDKKHKHLILNGALAKD